VVEESVRQQHPVKLLGRVESIKERFFAISVEKRLKHSAIVAITNAARKQLFDSLLHDR
jgi:LysR family transcriptional activator of nhaA